MPVPEGYSGVSDLSVWEFESGQEAIADRIERTFQSHDLGAVADQLERLFPVPDYIVVPVDRLCEIDDPAFPYSSVIAVGSYMVLKRTPLRFDYPRSSIDTSTVRAVEF